MASFFTEYGLTYHLRAAYRQEGKATFFLALITDTTVPTTATEDFSSLEEIAEGNGYSAGGIPLDADATDFETLDVSGGVAFVRLRDILLEATGGNIPDSGDPVSYALLIDDEGKVHIVWDFDSDWTVPVGEQRTLEDLEGQLAQPA